MKFGFCVMSDIDEIGFYPFIEGLGYDSAWVADSQMIYSDVYMVLALAAQQTKRLRLGPGTAICGTRIAPVQVTAMATLNRLAPGRVFLGIGTGNTAMRTMGQKPMRIADYSEYLRVTAALRAIHADGVAILLVEQNAAMALRLASRGYLLETGVCVVEDETRALIANDYVRKAYLGI